jgi:bacillopeptidase F (M6 metalloprotease family)
MKISIGSTIKWTIPLLLVMSGISTASAYIAYKVGYKALQGVDQPTANPAKKLTKIKKSSTRPTEFEPVDEKMILIKVYDHIHSQEKKSDSKLSSEKTKKKKFEKTSQNKLNSFQSKNRLVDNFSIKIQYGGVIL